MKSQVIFFIFISYFILFGSQFLSAQIVIVDSVDADMMVEELLGPGVSFENAEYTETYFSHGTFSNGESTSLGINDGIWLSSGAGYLIPGPNSGCDNGVNLGQWGNVLLNTLTNQSTWDASVLEFDFTPLNDTVKLNFVFGSEEYNEYVNYGGGAFNDVFGFFISGPKHDSGQYMNENIALIPGTNSIISINTVNMGYAACGVVPNQTGDNAEYFIDNTDGLTLEYDAFTTVIPLWFLVVPDSAYHIVLGVADVFDHIYDSGVFLEKASFKSPGAAEFSSFAFLAENNPDLAEDIVGVVDSSSVQIEFPANINLSNLVATFDVKGVEVYVDDSLQVSGITANDFSQVVNYHLEGYNMMDWTVYVYVSTAIDQQRLQHIVISPNPSLGTFTLSHVNRVEVKIYDLYGKQVYERKQTSGSELTIDNLSSGIYFIELTKDWISRVCKVIIN